MSGWAVLSNHSWERKRRAGAAALVAPAGRARTARRVAARARPLAILRPVILVPSPCALGPPASISGATRISRDLHAKINSTQTCGALLDGPAVQKAPSLV